MGSERASQRAPVAEQRPAAAIARAPPVAARPALAAPVRIADAPTGGLVQRFAAVSTPHDSAETEAVNTSRAVMRMSAPAGPAPVSQNAGAGIQRATAASAPALNPRPAAAAAPSGTGAGNLPAQTRKFMEPRFGADFSGVRVHTDAAAAQQARKLDAVAFTTGSDIYFGKGKFQPDSAAGKELIAHELTHTIQQGAVRQTPKAPAIAGAGAAAAVPAVRERPAARVHRGGGILDWFADKANYIPGYRMFCIVLGVNPINMSAADRSPGNVLRAVIEFIPGGKLIGDALASHGIFDRIGGWVDQKLRQLNMVGASFKQAIDKFIDGIGVTDILWVPGWGDLWEQAKRIFTEPIGKILDFVANLATEIIQFIREAILLPLAALAEGTRGYDLLKVVLGEDPVTGQPVPRNADTLIGGFMKLIGQEEVWENIKKANAIPRCWAWFQGAMNELMGFVRAIPGTFVSAFKALEVADMILVPRAFAKIASVFAGFIVEFLSWAGKAAWKLLEIIFEVVAPAAIPYLKKVGESFKQILRNPIGFVSNLVRAGKLGFERFADNIGTHLKKALIEWLTGSLPGVYIPQKLDIKEILKFTLSVLGLTWANIRGKLVKVIGETAVKGLETGFDIVVTLVRDGPAAAWDKIKEQLANLKDMVIGAITNFVVETIVKKAVMKVISLLVPGGAFIQAIISIYDTIMVFIDKLSKIIQVAKAFLDSMMDIVAGKLDGAAKKVESVLAGLLTLAISFLAGFLGLGKIADKVMEIIKKIRAPIDKALDFLINWIVTTAKKLFAGLFGGQKDDKRTPAQKEADLTKALAEAEQLGKGGASHAQVEKGLPAISKKYQLTSLAMIVDSKGKIDETVHFQGKVNPEKKSNPVKVALTTGKTEAEAIEFQWVKPALSGYPKIHIGKTNPVGPTSNNQVGKYTLKVTHPDALKIKDGATLQVKPAVTGNTVKDGMNDALKKVGYDRSAGDQAPRDTDHIVEKQIGGPDAQENLWPLNESVNRESGSRVRAQIAQISKDLGLSNLVGRWIKLKF